MLRSWLNMKSYRDKNAPSEVFPALLGAIL